MKISLSNTIFLTVLLSLLHATSVFASNNYQDRHAVKSIYKKIKHPRPVGYDKYLTYAANGLFDPSVQPQDKNMVNCDPISSLCDGYYFQREIVGRTDAEIILKEQEAKDYFYSKFGLDVEDPKYSGRIAIRMMQVDPRFNLHVISASKDQVPKEGWRIDDGGWVMFVTDPEGVELGGELAGVHAPFGSFVVYSEYYINRTKTIGHGRYAKTIKRKPLILQVRSLQPQIPGVLGFRCELVHPKYGLGIVQGWGEAILRDDGLKKMNITAFLAFPGLGNIPLLH